MHLNMISVKLLNIVAELLEVTDCQTSANESVNALTQADFWILVHIQTCMAGSITAIHIEGVARCKKG